MSDTANKAGGAVVYPQGIRTTYHITDGKIPVQIGGADSDLVGRVGAALRAACLEEFGATWTNDVAWKFARAAIATMRDDPDVPTLSQQIAAVLEEAEVSEAYNKHHAGALRAAANTLETISLPAAATSKNR